MRILVIGASGLVGSHVQREAVRSGHSVLGTYRRCPRPDLVPLDLEACSDERDATLKLEDLMAGFRPEALAFCAAWSWVDGCERDPDKAMRNNALHPRIAARLARRFRARFLHFSTSYVFNGRDGPYSEEDPPDPINAYGHSKLAGERAVQEASDGEALIARTILVFGDEAQRRNFVFQLLGRLREGQSMEVPLDQEGNPTDARDLAAAAVRLLTLHKTGVWNLAGPEPRMTRHEFARLICERHGLNADLLQPLTTEQLRQEAPRPLRAGLLTRKAEEFVRFRTAYEALREWDA